MTHVLVTRPLEASEQLARQLDALGLFPIVMPLYTFAARNPAIDISSVWSEKRRRKLAVFTSPRAVQFGLPYIPAHDQLNGLEIAVVGSATRASLESFGYPGTFAGLAPGLPVKTSCSYRTWLTTRVLP